jgi:hypothetical protein
MGAAAAGNRYDVAFSASSLIVHAGCNSVRVHALNFPGLFAFERASMSDHSDVMGYFLRLWLLSAAVPQELPQELPQATSLHNLTIAAHAVVTAAAWP